MQLDHARAISAAVSDPANSPASATLHGDSVTLSGATGLVQQALTAGADTRASRVLELRQQIQTGQYTIDPAAISSALTDASIRGE